MVPISAEARARRRSNVNNAGSGNTRQDRRRGRTATKGIREFPSQGVAASRVENSCARIGNAGRPDALYPAQGSLSSDRGASIRTGRGARLYPEGPDHPFTKTLLHKCLSRPSRHRSLPIQDEEMYRVTPAGIFAGGTSSGQLACVQSFGCS